jgi:hypothetical protein
VKNHSSSVGAASLAKDPEDFAPNGAYGSDAATSLQRGCNQAASLSFLASWRLIYAFFILHSSFCILKMFNLTSFISSELHGMSNPAALKFLAASARKVLKIVCILTYFYNNA